MIIMLVDTCCLGNRQNNQAFKEIKKEKGKSDFLKTNYLTFQMWKKKRFGLKAGSCKQFSSLAEQSVMPHNLFYNKTLTDDSTRDRDHLSSNTSLNTEGSSKLSTPTTKKTLLA